MFDVRLYKGSFFSIINDVPFFMSGSLGFPVKGLVLDNIFLNNDMVLYVYEKVSSFNGEVSRYGFLSESDLKNFMLLLDNDVKPKAASSIVSELLDEHTLESIIVNKNVALLESVSGIGKKTALNIVESLSKVFESDVLLEDEVLSELMKLGFTKADGVQRMRECAQGDNESIAQYIMRLVD